MTDDIDRWFVLAGIRKCANFTNDVLLANTIDTFLKEHITEVVEKSLEFTQLPCVKVVCVFFPSLSIVFLLRVYVCVRARFIRAPSRACFDHRVSRCTHTLDHFDADHVR